LKVPILNLLSNVAERAGHVNIRVGGNTQDTAVFVSSIADGHAIEKQQGVTNNPASGIEVLRSIMTIMSLFLSLKTQTPAVLYTDELFYLMSNVSALTNVRWYLGRLQLSGLYVLINLPWRY
jgi:hypothetical protein